MSLLPLLAIGTAIGAGVLIMKNNKTWKPTAVQTNGKLHRIYLFQGEANVDYALYAKNLEAAGFSGVKMWTPASGPPAGWPPFPASWTANKVDPHKVMGFEGTWHGANIPLPAGSFGYIES